MGRKRCGANKMTISAYDLIVGHVYRGKRFREFLGQNNDRVVLFMSDDERKVQYDSDTVKVGQLRPIVDTKKFLKWAKEDVTHLYQKEGETKNNK